MKKVKIALVFGAGVLAGSMFTPMASSSAAGMVLASVEWVQSQLNPINSRVAVLEQEIQTLKQSAGNPAMPTSVYVKPIIADVHKSALNGSTVAASLPVSQSLKVIQQITSADGKFYRVEYAAGKFGWISVSDISTSAVSKPASFKVNVKSFMYKSADTGSTKAASIAAGQNLKYVSAFRNSKTKEIWINAELSNGTRGWIQLQNGEVK